MDFNLIAYYQTSEGFAMSVLYNGRPANLGSIGVTDIKSLVAMMKDAKANLSTKVPLGLINMVPDVRKAISPEATRLSPVLEKQVVMEFYE